MNDEERATKLAQMHQCLDIAADIWNMLSSADEAGVGEVHIDRVKEVIRKRFRTPLHQARLDAIGYSIVMAMNKYDITPCGLWSFAHNLNHCLFEDDISEIKRAIAESR